MAYTILYSEEATRQLQNLDKRIARQIVDKVAGLSVQPHTFSGIKALKGTLKNIYRIRSGDWRILYQVKDDQLLILVLKISNRKDVY